MNRKRNGGDFFGFFGFFWSICAHNPRTHSPLKLHAKVYPSRILVSYRHFQIYISWKREEESAIILYCRYKPKLDLGRAGGRVSHANALACRYRRARGSRRSPRSRTRELNRVLNMGNKGGKQPGNPFAEGCDAANEEAGGNPFGAEPPEPPAKKMSSSARAVAEWRANTTTSARDAVVARHADRDRQDLWGGAAERSAAEGRQSLWGGGVDSDDAGANSKLSQIQKLQDESLATTERTMAQLGEAREVGLHTNDMLAVQGEQIDRIQSVLDKMHTDLDYSDQLMKKLASPFGFGGSVKQHAKTFERLHGGMAEWSGPMKKRGDVRRVYRERFFALLDSKLFYFVDALHVKRPKGVIELSGGAMLERVAESPGHKYEFRLRVVRPRPHAFLFQCSTDREYLGWLAVLERKVDPTSWRLSKTNAASAAINVKAREAGMDVGDLGLGGPRGGGGSGGGSSGSAQQQRYEDPAKAAASRFEAQLDANLDSISDMLADLGEIAQAQGNAVDLQTQKLDRVETSVDEANTRINKLNGRGRKLLR